MRINTSGMVDGLLARQDINRTGNDYSAHLRSRLPNQPGPLVARQYGLDVREARKLEAAIKKLPERTQRAALTELAKRATLDRLQMPRLGGVKLSENAAKLLTSLAKELGMELTFKSGQERPLHPVG